MSRANCSAAVLSDATEGRINIWIPCTKPIAERGPQQLACRGRRRTLHHEVLAVEEVGGVFRIRRHGAKPRKRPKRRARPLPAVPDEILDAPVARAGGIAARGLGIPAGEVEDAFSRPCRLRAKGASASLAGARLSLARA